MQSYFAPKLIHSALRGLFIMAAASCIDTGKCRFGTHSPTCLRTFRTSYALLAH